MLVIPAKSAQEVEVPEDLKTESIGTVETAAGEKLLSLGGIIAEAAKGLGRALRDAAEEISPDEVEVELKFGLKEGCDAWFVNAEGEQAISVKMKWVASKKA